MVRIERVRWNDGAGRAVLDLQVSTSAELPNKGSTIGYRMTVCAGSIAQIIQTGVYATLDDDGNWYADGSEVS